MTTKITVSEARSRLAAGEVPQEISWVTGSHHMDPDYSVGEYVTRESAGDWTNHPGYSGVRSDERGENESVQQWMLSHLPDSGQVKWLPGAAEKV